jgi:hypothetical protein
MSEDLNGGHIAVPKKLPLWPFLGVVAAIVATAFTLGAWTYALGATQRLQGERIETHEAFIRRVVAYMCMDCASKNGYDCRFICGTEDRP